MKGISLVKVTEQEGMEIIGGRARRGLFWFKDSSGRYIGIDNLCGEAFTEAFGTKRELVIWAQDYVWA